MVIAILSAPFPRKAGKLLVVDAVFGLYMLDLEKVTFDAIIHHDHQMIKWSSKHLSSQWSWWSGGWGEPHPSLPAAWESWIHPTLASWPGGRWESSQGDDDSDNDDDDNDLHIIGRFCVCVTKKWPNFFSLPNYF